MSARPDSQGAPPSAVPKPEQDAPSAEVLDELLRAFSVDVTDTARRSQVDLSSSEVEELLAGSPEPEPGPGSGPGPASGSGPGPEPAPEVDGSAASRGVTTIRISAEDELPDPVYLAAGDPLLNRATEQQPSPATETNQRVFIDDAVTGGHDDVISLQDAAAPSHAVPRRRERRKAAKQAANRRRLKWVVLVVALVVVVVAGLAVLGSGLFAIEDVEVQGAARTDPAALEAVVEELRGTPVLRADTQAAERALEALPWVEEARVSRQFPRGARIELRERTPVATYQAADGAFRVIDTEGQVLEVLESQPVEYPLITSQDAPDLPPGEPAPPGFAAGASLVQALTPEMRMMAASVTTSADGSDLRMTLTDGVEVRFGEGQDLVTKLVRLQTWLSNRPPGAVSTVDVSTAEVTTRP